LDLGSGVSEMNLFSRVIDLFRKPSAFEGQPVMWAYSQIGHGYLGMAVTTIITWLLLYFGGSYPNDLLIAVAVPIVYFFWWEIDIQGWRGWDTIEDSLFVAIGSALFIVIDMSEVIDRLAMWVAITGVGIIAGIIRRME
jgi:hypothetical protein